MLSIVEPQLHKIGVFDAQHSRDALDLAFFGDRNAVLSGREREQTAEECELLLVSGGAAEITCDDEIVAATEQQVARLCEADDEDGLVSRQLSLTRDQVLHHFRFGRADVLVGMRHSAQQIRKARKVLGAVGLETIERLEETTKRVVRLILGGRFYA